MAAKPSFDATSLKKQGLTNLQQFRFEGMRHRSLSSFLKRWMLFLPSCDGLGPLPAEVF